MILAEVNTVNGTKSTITRGVKPKRYKIEVMLERDFDGEHRWFTLDS